MLYSNRFSVITVSYSVLLAISGIISIISKISGFINYSVLLVISVIMYYY